jgi:hypothetical protein
MFRKRIATLDLVTELPGRPFSEAEREVRRALDRYIVTDVERRRLGWVRRFLSPRQWLNVQAKLGEELLHIKAVIALSEEHKAAFQDVMRSLPRGTSYRKAWGQLLTRP